jgi:hypothetical protein
MEGATNRCERASDSDSCDRSSARYTGTTGTVLVPVVASQYQLASTSSTGYISRIISSATRHSPVVRRVSVLKAVSRV